MIRHSGASDPLREPFYYFRGTAPVFMVNDHAGREVPENLGDMGVSAGDWKRHIACDWGIGGVGRRLCALVNGSLVEQRFSRLVADCNRQDNHFQFAPETSDGTGIPANRNLTPEERENRRKTIFAPYHRFIDARFQEILEAHSHVLFVSLHSFAPALKSMEGERRPWEIGFLHAHDPYTARKAIRFMAEEIGLKSPVGDNKPYQLDLDREYTTPVHAGRRRRPALEIEIRQDLIQDEAGRKLWAERLAKLFAALIPQLPEVQEFLGRPKLCRGGSL